MVINNVQGDITMILERLIEILILLILDRIRNCQEKSKDQKMSTGGDEDEDSVTLIKRWHKEVEIESGETKIKEKCELEVTMKRSHKPRGNDH